MPKKPFSPADSNRPLYRRRRPKPQQAAQFGQDPAFIDLTNAHALPFGTPSSVEDAVDQFDARAAAAVSGGAGGQPVDPDSSFLQLLDIQKPGGGADNVIVPAAQCLAVIAYPDYFPGIRDKDARLTVSEAILTAAPGWCGTFGPGVDGAFDVAFGDPSEGNYDMSQMHLLQIAYRYYDELLPAARDLLITQLLARGRIHRPDLDDTFTSGGNPNDWSRAGFVSPLGQHVRIGETENHIFTILTARYLTNQLLYQRNQAHENDNRRNGDVMGGPNCMDLLLSLLRDILRDDFSEYNAKNYQTETRYALLNLTSYAYDHEIRLGARLALDYISAHLAVSSNDLRRMAPFRRRNETKNVTLSPDGSMAVSLLETTTGADPMAQHYAMLAGNLRIYESRNWHIKSDGTDGNDAVMYSLSDYRLPPSIHDLFVTDAHRRFYQRLHRIQLGDVEVSGRNVDNQEIYAGSPSYLISAGGEFATWAVDPGPVSLSEKLRRKNDQQLGVAVPSSFMPTTRMEGDCGDPTLASDLIQFGRFSDVDGVHNYGVCPDFICGPQIHIPTWCRDAMEKDSADGFGKFRFVNRGSAGKGPGFYLALLIDGDFAVMEAFDTWLHSDLMFDQFRINVFVSNRDLMERGLQSNVREEYKTQNGNLLNFRIFNEADDFGAIVGGVASQNSRDAEADLFGNASQDFPVQFLNGTVLNSQAEGVIEITNLFLKTKLVLDMSDQAQPRRTSESGEVEAAGAHQEVWVNFAWNGSHEGDFFHPFNTFAAAVEAVADGGTIRIVPGTTSEPAMSRGGKRIRVVAPSGGVAFNVH